jgi:hypothetical protein
MSASVLALASAQTLGTMRASTRLSLAKSRLLLVETVSC